MPTVTIVHRDSAFAESLARELRSGDILIASVAATLAGAITLLACL
jgi:hypothetical protein